MKWNILKILSEIFDNLVLIGMTNKSWPQYKTNTMNKELILTLNFKLSSCKICQTPVLLLTLSKKQGGSQFNKPFLKVNVNTKYIFFIIRMRRARIFVRK